MEPLTSSPASRHTFHRNLISHGKAQAHHMPYASTRSSSHKPSPAAKGIRSRRKSCVPAPLSLYIEHSITRWRSFGPSSTESSYTLRSAPECVMRSAHCLANSTTFTTCVPAFISMSNLYIADLPLEPAPFLHMLLTRIPPPPRPTLVRSACTTLNAIGYGATSSSHLERVSPCTFGHADRPPRTRRKEASAKSLQSPE